MAFWEPGYLANMAIILHPLGTPLGIIAREVCAQFQGLIRKNRVDF